MPARTIVRTVAALAALAAPLAAQQPLPAYGPVKSQYRLVSSTHTSQNMMGQVQEFETSADQLTTVAVTRAGDALTLMMTLDTASLTSTAPMPLPDLSSAFGNVLTGPMTLDGKVGATAVTDRSGAPSQSPIASNMRSFLPRLKIGATPGAAWTDTLITNTKQNGADVATTAVYSYTLAGDTTVTGAGAWKVVATSTGTSVGHGNQGGADFTLTGDTKGKGTFVIGAGGVLLGGETVTEVSMSVQVAAAGITIPITQTQTTKVVKLP